LKQGKARGVFAYENDTRKKWRGPAHHVEPTINRRQMSVIKLTAPADVVHYWRSKSGYLHFLSADELRLELGFAVLKHPNDLA
jgi:hypothetical protein